MNRSSFLAAFLLVGICAGLGVGLPALQLPETPEKPPVPAALPPRVLPGVQPGGTILLPNQWSLRPAGRHLALGDFPINIALHPSGKWLAVLHAGFSTHEV